MDAMIVVPRVTSVEVVRDQVVHITFKDGVHADVDLADLTDHSGVFEALRDPDFFIQVQIDPTFGTLAWPNGADIAPETLYELARPR